MLYTVGGAKYVTPTLFEASYILKLYDIPNFGFETLMDVANLASGGEVISVGRSVRPFAKKSLGDDTSSEVLVKNYISALSIIHEMIDWSAIPGRTPILKSAFLLKALGDDALSGRSNNAVSGLCKSIEIDQKLPLTYKQLSYPKNRPEYKEDNERGEDPDKGCTKEDAHYALQKLVELNHIKDNATMYKIARNLDHCIPLRSIKDVVFKPDNNGDSIRTRSIVDMDEIPKLSPAEHSYGRTLSLYRIISQEAIIREKGFYSSKKQLLYILLDVSGSMADEDGVRIQRAGGVILNRLAAVMREEAELYITPFDTHTHPERKISTAEQAMDAMEFIHHNHYSGGGTDIPMAIRHAIARVNILDAQHDLVKPDILIITDGGSHSGGLPSTKKLLDDKIKIHAFLVGDESPAEEWARLATSTGGVALVLR